MTQSPNPIHQPEWQQLVALAQAEFAFPDQDFDGSPNIPAWAALVHKLATQPLSPPAQVGTSGASAERERDWESNCDECAGTGKVDVSEALHVDGRYMGDQLLRETCNTCTGYGFKVCLADIPKEIQQEAAARPAPHVNVQLAYGYLWHVNNEPGTPAPMYSPEKAAYKARHYLSALMTHEERGIAINAVRGLLGGSDE